MTDMTPKEVLSEIRSAGKLFAGTPSPANNSEVTIILETDRPPLKIRDGDDYWILVGWVEIGRLSWKFEYRFQRSKHCVVVMSPTGVCVEVDNTRTMYRDDAESMAKALNGNVMNETTRHPFRVDQV